MGFNQEWEEVKKLAADFQRTQSGITNQRISERNCIEIIKKLTKLSILDVIFTTDGKEYVTPDYLMREIQDELTANGGRISFTELMNLLNVDYTHIQAKSSELVMKTTGISIVLDELVDNYYKDQLAQEINERLQENGFLNISELTKIHSLPIDFLLNLVSKRIGKFIKGVIESKTLFTEQYLSYHQSKIAGIFSAITHPTRLSQIINRYNLPEKIVSSTMDKLISSGRLNGSLSLGSNKTYIPSLYLHNQMNWVENFYRSNGYLEFDSLSRVGISEPKLLIKKPLFSNMKFLKTVCVGEELFNTFENTIDEVVEEESWLELADHVPSCFTERDIELMTDSYKLKSKNAFIIIEGKLFSKLYIDKLLSCFDDYLKSKAEEELKKGTLHDFYLGNEDKTKVKDEKTFEHKEEKELKDDEKDKKKKNKRTFATQNREIKTKAIKKKKEEKVETPKKELKLKISQEDIFSKLKDDYDEEIVKALCAYLMELLMARYLEICSKVFNESMELRAITEKKTYSQLQTNVNNIYPYISLYQKGIDYFSEENRNILTKYLLKTYCADLVNNIILYLTYEDVHNIPNNDVRLKLINKLEAKIKESMIKLNSSLNESIDSFLENFNLVASKIDLMLKNESKERLISCYRQKLLMDLNESSDWSVIMNSILLLLFNSKYSAILHMGGRFAVSLLNFLKPSLEEDLYNDLKLFESLIIRRLKGENVEDDNLIGKIKARVIGK